MITIHLPPLRERDGDVAIVAEQFLKKMAQRHSKNVKGFEPDTLDTLEAHSWPGNVRELENAIERMVILTPDDVEYLSPDLLPLQIRNKYSKDAPASQEGLFPPTIKGQKEAFEQNRLLEALKKNKWNKSAGPQRLVTHSPITEALQQSRSDSNKHLARHLLYISVEFQLQEQGKQHRSWQIRS